MIKLFNGDSKDTDIVSDLNIGKAGEHLVCADLIIKGYQAFLSDQGLSYDVIVDLYGKLIKVQVKSTRGQRTVPQREHLISGYLYHIKRCGKSGNNEYSKNVVDIFALVAIDTGEIGYLCTKDIRRTMVLRSKFMQYPTNKGTFLTDLTFEKALENLYGIY